MGNYFNYYQSEPEETIICVNSFATTSKNFEYVIEVFANNDDEPSLNMYKFYNKTRYNH